MNTAATDGAPTRPPVPPAPPTASPPPPGDGHTPRSIAESIRRLELRLGFDRARSLDRSLLAELRLAEPPERYEAGLVDLLTLRGVFAAAPYRIHDQFASEFVHHTLANNGGRGSHPTETVSFGAAVNAFRDELLNRLDSPTRRTLTRASNRSARPNEPRTTDSPRSAGWRRPSAPSSSPPPHSGSRGDPGVDGV